jgi:hypothetical protein
MVAAVGPAVQSAFAQAGSAPTRFVAIGCLTRGAAAGQFIITDTRGETPRQYRLDIDAKEVSWRVGQALEVHGTLSPAQGQGPAVLKVSNLIYISPSCAPAKK